MLEELRSIEKKLADSIVNICEYDKQLNEDNPYRADLLFFQQRLAEVDRIIVKRTEDEKKIKNCTPQKLSLAV